MNIDKKFHLFTWKSNDECGGGYCSRWWAESITELYAGSFANIEDAQKHYRENHKNKDVAEIVTARDGEMHIVAALDDSGVSWTLETKQVTNPQPELEPEPEPEPIEFALSASGRLNNTIREQINA